VGEVGTGQGSYNAENDIFPNLEKKKKAARLTLHKFTRVTTGGNGRKGTKTRGLERFILLSNRGRKEKVEQENPQ